MIIILYYTVFKCLSKKLTLSIHTPLLVYQKRITRSPTVLVVSPRTTLQAPEISSGFLDFQIRLRDSAVITVIAMAFFGSTRLNAARFR